MSCARCHRPTSTDPSGDWFVAKLRARDTKRLRAVRRLCSWACLETWLMIDATPNETAALEHAGTVGGQYLDSVRCTDLARLSLEQWLTFIETVVTGYCDKLVELAERDAQRVSTLRANTEVPF